MVPVSFRGDRSKLVDATKCKLGNRIASHPPDDITTRLHGSMAIQHSLALAYSFLPPVQLPRDLALAYIFLRLFAARELSLSPKQLR